MLLFLYFSHRIDNLLEVMLGDSDRRLVVHKRTIKKDCCFATTKWTSSQDP